ncbi:MAG TPA: gliding motility protein GldL [Bacteroidia bacterium]|nr:gliding motility protein GldL [Bacteroidia bacterium]
MSNFFESKTGKNVMAKAYGLGAAIVIVGALFKIMHWPGADTMLIVGLGTEALIFTISAFEPPHHEPDWTLVYPELAGMEPTETKSKKEEKQGSISQQLDKMLEEAKVTPDLISSLGSGLKSLSDNVSNMSSLSNATVATSEYTENVQKASKSLEAVNSSYHKAADAMNTLAAISQGTKEYQNQVESISAEMNRLTSNLASLNTVYGSMLSAMGKQGA